MSFSFRHTISLVFLLALCFPSSCQNYIGLHKEEIRERVRQEQQGFVFTKEVENGDKSFIKFENTFEEQTLLFVLNAKGYCTSVSRMYNTWLFNRVKTELDLKFIPAGHHRWIETLQGKEFEVLLRKSEWFITVVTLPLKQ